MTPLFYSSVLLWMSFDSYLQYQMCIRDSPSTVLVFINNMKVNIGLCLVGVIIGEFLAARAGLGYLIIYGSQTFKMDYVVTVSYTHLPQEAI